MTHRPGLYQALEKRQLVYQVTDPALAGVLDRGPMTVYCGFDPTADSLHLGNLMPLMMLRRFQSYGHKPIALVGGSTGMIGDPGGKTSERTLLDRDTLAKNLAGIKNVIGRFLDFEGPKAATIVNNADWTVGISYLDFLRDIGKHFSVNAMIAKESVKERLSGRDQGISYTEFSYMLLQSYDYYTLHRDRGCTLQIGGSDQWGNITAGTDLIRRLAAAEGRPAPEVFGLTNPLVTKADGTKYGKSEHGAIWLEARYTSPYRFYQFLIQTQDEDVMKLVRYLTQLPDEEVEQLAEATQSAPEKRVAQRALAQWLTTLVHGEAETRRVEHASQAFFSGKLHELDERTLAEVVADVPSVQRSRSDLDAGLSLLDLLVEGKLCPSKGMARKDVAGGGVYVNEQRVVDDQKKISADDLIGGRFVVVRRGKKNYCAYIFS